MRNKDYNVLLSRQAQERAASYLTHLRDGKQPGRYLAKKLAGGNGPNITVERLLELLIQTKVPQIFAESAVWGNGSDWNQDELTLLGDIAVATPVTIYDNGRHSSPDIHTAPFEGTLLFVPGALLRNGRGHDPADWEVVNPRGEIDSEAYYRLYERRLLPALLHANEAVGGRGAKALVTIPGLGCGQFAGVFHGHLGEELSNTLQRLIREHGHRFPHIRAVYFDPYRECENQRMELGGIHFFVRPLTKGNEAKPQLCRPTAYEEEEGDDFSNCQLFSVVAWDHVSWPGNDYYSGVRATDDGVKAAATNVMEVMTGISGNYNPDRFKYIPPPEYRDWSQVISKNAIEMEVTGKLTVFPS